ncbi:putative lipoprotein [Treponema primitia ZAS-2]|uniref:Putative lipoprotein n=1 Tax=Treponema primitia (strain ATCC BAA-887 / DSM 12427 / ZAS-2) TaxID=545694 RepID=F5YKB9_TREPZ|nr:putative lipoprotein [Treponema primitia ZAS-2]
MTKLFAIILLLSPVLSCGSRPIAISETATPAEMTQRAQEASDRNRYGLSLQYYQAILERFPRDINNVCAAEYEIAFIHYKQKKYDQARSEFESLLDRYNTPDAELLPSQFRTLANIVLAKMNERRK